MPSTADTDRLFGRFEQGRSQLPETVPDSLRRSALAAFAEAGFPTLRDEAWKYTNLGPLTRRDFDPFADTVGLDLAAWEEFLVPGADRIVIVNGCVDTRLSDTGGACEGVTIESLASASGPPEHVEPDMRSSAPLTALNTAFTRDGVVLRIADGTVVERPVQILHIACDTGAEIALHPRTVVIAGAHAQANVVETFVGDGGSRSWTNAVTEFRIGCAAQIGHIKHQAESVDAYHTALVEVHVASEAKYSATALGLGSELSRHEINVFLDGMHSSCELRGGVILRGRQHGDHTTLVEHRAGHAASSQVFRNVLDDRARSVFQGGVKVSPGAVGTDSSQSNGNLLLAPGTRADSKPELRILADDVKCSHGATVGDLDRDAMFYLLSRGMSPDAARGLLIRAFVSEVVDGAPEGVLRGHLEEAVTRWMGGLSG